MSEEPALSRRAAEAVRRLGGEETPNPRELPGALPVPALICLGCGQVNPNPATYCNQCGHSLEVPVGGNADGYVRAVDLLRSGELAEAEVHDLLERLQRECAFYTAGTRYSVFGPQAPSTPHG
jgi:hypothetical protein